VTVSNRPVIEFPCEGYPIRVIGQSDAALRSSVLAVVRQFDASFDEATVAEQPSRHGKYTSVRLAIRATGSAQLKALHEALLANPLVRVVL